MQKGMQKYGALSTSLSSFIIILSLILISVNSYDANNVLAQPLPYEMSSPFPSTIQSDVELIEDTIKRQGQTNNLMK